MDHPAQHGTDVDVLLEIHDKAHTFYTEKLGGASTREVGAFLAAVQARGLSPDHLAHARIGFVPDKWTNLTDHLRAAGYTDSQLLDSGLGLATRRGTVVDRFRGRVMFPVAGVHQPDSADDVAAPGDVIAFIGRSLNPGAGGEGAPPKHLNSPDTALYRKGEVLYGFAALSVVEALTQRGAVPVIVEGPFDAEAVTAAGAGRHVGVATGGTAFTAAQAALLNSVVPLERRGVMTAFDEDTAGRAATRAAYGALREVGAWPTRAPLLPSCDPSSQLTRYGADVLQESLAAGARFPVADLVVDAKIEPWAARLDTVEGQWHASRAAAPVLAEMPALRVWPQINRVGTKHGIPTDMLREEVLQSMLPSLAEEAGSQDPWGQGPHDVAVESLSWPTSPDATASPAGVAHAVATAVERDTPGASVQVAHEPATPHAQTNIVSVDVQHPSMSGSVHASVSVAAGSDVMTVTAYHLDQQGQASAASQVDFVTGDAAAVHAVTAAVRLHREQFPALSVERVEDLHTRTTSRAAPTSQPASSDAAAHRSTPVSLASVSYPRAVTTVTQTPPLAAPSTPAPAGVVQARHGRTS